MKSSKNFALSASLLVLTLGLSAGGFAAAADDAATTARDRSATTLPGDRTPETAEEVRTQVDRTNQQAQGRVESQRPGQDITDTPGQQACENSHAPTGSPSLADNENAQGGNPQANENARGSRADENQSAQGAANSRADLAQAGDDCLDVNSTIRENNEDARGQGQGNDTNDRSDQSRTPRS